MSRAKYLPKQAHQYTFLGNLLETDGKCGLSGDRIELYLARDSFRLEKREAFVVPEATPPPMAPRSIDPATVAWQCLGSYFRLGVNEEICSRATCETVKASVVVVECETSGWIDLLQVLYNL